MRGSLTVLLLFLSSLILATEIQVVFVDYDRDIGVVKRFPLEEGEHPIFSIFQHLYDPPPGLRSFVPPGCLRAAYILEDAVVVDLRSERLNLSSFYAERMMLYQILLSIFRSLDVEKVYIMKDGKPAKVLWRLVDISLSFGREEWTEWPVH